MLPPRSLQTHATSCPRSSKATQTNSRLLLDYPRVPTSLNQLAQKSCRLEETLAPLFLIFRQKIGQTDRILATMSSETTASRHEGRQAGGTEGQRQRRCRLKCQRTHRRARLRAAMIEVRPKLRTPQESGLLQAPPSLVLASVRPCT